MRADPSNMHGPGDVRFFDRFAPLYDLFMPRADPEVLASALSLAERPVERVIDVAGGSGRAALALPVPDPTVLDAARGMLSRARDRGLSAVQADAGRLPVREGAVDAVTVVDAFHHLPDQEAALAEIARVLGPGGVLVVREFDPGTLRGRAIVAAERAVGFDSTFLGPDALADRLARVGLDATVVDRGFGYTAVGVKRTTK